MKGNTSMTDTGAGSVGADGFEFELEPLDPRQAFGFRGVVGPYGSVEASTPAPGRRERPSQEVHLKGEGFPETVFSGGAHDRPSLDGGRLKVDGTVVDLDLVVKGVRKGRRWLEIGFRDRSYKYTGDLGSVARLTREGATVSFTQGRFVRGIGLARVGKTEGAVDAVDLAIAIVLETVDRSCMSTTGALFAIPFNFLFGRSASEGTFE
ncbi:hypothetical protein [Streptomyces sp. NPDC060031]|uniref:hypothetical protein n=1 Tax=Streptomyces sp. NPDC060031 TaxID=3347043 RepID=UPI0036CC0BE2